MERLEEEKRERREKLEREKKEKVDKVEQERKERKAKEEEEREERERKKPSIVKFFNKVNEEEKIEEVVDLQIEYVQRANFKFKEYQMMTEAIKVQKESIIRFGDLQKKRNNF